MWPGVTQLPYYKQLTFPNWNQNILSTPQINEEGHHLLQRMLNYDPKDRLSAQAALMHPYFKSLDIVNLPGTNFAFTHDDKPITLP